MPPTNILDLIEDKFTVGDGCWIWRAKLVPKGYGQQKWRGQAVKAHRVLYELLVGPIPEGMHLDHLCRNRACVNPGHLEPVTCKENIQRGWAARRPELYA